MTEDLRRVRDWRALERWAAQYRLPIVQRGKHRALMVNGRRMFISATGSDCRGALNARAQIMRLLAAP